MSGIYIHVPFCWQRCHYCDFYSTLKTGKRKEFAEKILKEIGLRRDFISDRNVDTIYFGGGTPSLLDPKDLGKIISEVKNSFSLDDDHEITLEANPDDLTTEYLKKIRGTGINRLSIGVQSFDDKDLQMLNRRHDSARATEAVKDSCLNGIENISIDLIYGLPGQDIGSWIKNLEKAAQLMPEHISAYNLTYEKGTNFYRWLKEGKIQETSDEESNEMFETAVDFLRKHGFEQYEISNYARDGKYSRHNTKYWFGEQYLGLGPSAHSFNGRIRQWNISNLEKWLDSDFGRGDFYHEEEIDPATSRNEMIMTRLRTKWGIPKDEYVRRFGKESWKELLYTAKNFIENGLMEYNERSLVISLKGKFLSDGIIADLFVLDD